VSRNHTLFWWIFPAFAIVSLASIILVVSLGAERSRAFYFEREQDNLKRFATILADEMRVRDREKVLEMDSFVNSYSQLSESRITVIDMKGMVLADSHHDHVDMENHRNRPELIEALEYGKGVSSRYSSTLQTRMNYVAVKVFLEGRKVLLRLATPIPELDKDIRSSFGQHLNTALAIMFLGTVVVWFLTKRITKPIEKLTRDVHQVSHGMRDRPLEENGAAELRQLTHAINLMFRHSKERIATIIQQRNQQESILTSMKEGVISLNHLGQIVSINPKARHIFYCSPGVEVLGRDLSEICRSRSILDEVEKIKKTGEEFDIEVEMDNYGEVILQVRGCTILSEGQTDNSYLVVINDITHLRRLENMRRDFVANVSHELKTPLTSIRGYSETLAGMPEFEGNDLAKRFLTKVEHNADRLHHIIEDLLTLSRIEQSGLSHDDLKGTSPRFIMDQLLMELTEEQQRRMVWPPKCQLDKVLVHGPLIHQALFNLIDNALKYSGQDGVVEVTIEDRGSMIAFGIHDNGPGIPEKHLPMLTQRFYRVDKARSREKGGTGLGLSIVKHIIDAHHGELKIDSSVGEGSSFIISLPKDHSVLPI
jgi:two-component system phosphate regulon sensor histidine kinase PhoR